MYIEQSERSVDQEADIGVRHVDAPVNESVVLSNSSKSPCSRHRRECFCARLFSTSGREMDGRTLSSSCLQAAIIPDLLVFV